MSIFGPTKILEKISDITPQLLNEMGVEVLLLDVDNTLTSYKSHEPAAGSLEWIKEMKKEGFKLIIVSNNYKSRVMPLAAKFDLDYITFAMKPLPFGYLKAKREFGFEAFQCAIVGDQVFTDITGANLCGMKSILLEPIEMEESSSFKFRRKLEKNIREKYK